MKKVVFTIMVCLTANILLAQSDYTRSLNDVNWVKIETKARIVVKTHDKNELLIKAISTKPLPERAKGLKLVGAGGEDNTDVGFNVSKVGNDLFVRNIAKSRKAEIYLPKTQKISVKNSWSGDIIIDGFTAEVEANANLNGGLEMSNLSGPVTAYALNQDVSVVFDALPDNPIVIRTTNGAIDITVPGSAKADLKMGSWNGQVYTNFDISRPDKDGMKSVSGKTIKGAINGGGTSVILESTNGNIYLRKK